MADFLSTPKLPVNIADIATDAKERAQRMMQAQKSTQPGKGTDATLSDACRQMESLFINHLFKEMRATINKSGFISGGKAEEIFTSLLDVELSKKMSNAGGIGLSSILMKQLGGQSEKKDDPESR